MQSFINRFVIFIASSIKFAVIGVISCVTYSWLDVFSKYVNSILLSLLYFIQSLVKLSIEPILILVCINNSNTIACNLCISDISCISSNLL